MLPPSAALPAGLALSSLAPLFGPLATLAMGAVLIALVVMVVGLVAEHGDATAFDCMTAAAAGPGPLALAAMTESRPAA